jgi:hypothetical protein
MIVYLLFSAVGVSPTEDCASSFNALLNTILKVELEFQKWFVCVSHGANRMAGLKIAHAAMFFDILKNCTL